MIYDPIASGSSDVYDLMASACFNMPIHQVSPPLMCLYHNLSFHPSKVVVVKVSKEDRDKAKTISLGIVYGMVMTKAIIQVKVLISTLRLDMMP
jgi:hypothetical protein